MKKYPLTLLTKTRLLEAVDSNALTPPLAQTHIIPPITNAVINGVRQREGARRVG